MEKIIDPIDRKLIKKELNKKHFLRPTNKAGNELYDISAHEAPNVMQEIGRLREVSFRAGGGGTGNSIDIDEFDVMDKPYRQLIVWDPHTEEIVGGYRYLKGCDAVVNNGEPNFVSAHMFHYTDFFVKDYLPTTTELGRAFVQPVYQTAKMGMKSLFALDNLWDGLGALIYKNKDIQYLIGKVTIYRDYPEVARDLIYAYLHRYFPDDKGLVRPVEPMDICAEAQEIADQTFTGTDQQTNYKLLQKAVRGLGENIPAMFNAYIGLTSTMKTFGNGINYEFGDVYETQIMITTADLFEEKRRRYIVPYIDYLRLMQEQRRRIREARKTTKDGTER